MSGRKYFCFCESNCKFETMNKEQILSAIAQAAETGLVFDEDAAFITKVKESNAGGMVTFWVGTQAQYNKLQSIDKNCLYIITDSNKDAQIEAKVEELLRIVNERPRMVFLWENTNVLDNGEYAAFKSQTVPLDLSGYATVLVQFSTYPIETLDNETGDMVDEPAIVEQVCAIGSGKYSTVFHVYGSTSATRYFRVDRDGIKFRNALENNVAQNSTGYTNNNVLIPCKIFAM